MKHQLKTSILCATAIVGTFFMQSCKKEEITKPFDKTVKATTATQSRTMLKQAVDFNLESQDIIMHVLSSSSKVMRVSGPIVIDPTCATITIDSVSMPRRIEIDFGTGCTDPDGKIRSGKLIGYYNNLGFANDGDSTRLEYQNFGIDSFVSNGSFTTKRVSTDGSGNYVGYMESHQNVVNTISGVSYNGYYRLDAVDNPNSGDISFTGVRQITNNLGESINQNVTSPLVLNKALGCSENFVEGTLLTQISGQSDRVIDYGTGRCDDEATETVDGVTTTIYLN